MKELRNLIRNGIGNAKDFGKKQCVCLQTEVSCLKTNLKEKMADDDGNFFSEHMMGIVIVAAIGLAVWVAMDLLFSGTVLKGITEKFTKIFTGK